MEKPYLHPCLHVTKKGMYDLFLVKKEKSIIQVNPYNRTVAGLSQDCRRTVAGLSQDCCSTVVAELARMTEKIQCSSEAYLWMVLKKLGRQLSQFYDQIGTDIYAYLSDLMMTIIF